MKISTKGRDNVGSQSGWVIWEVQVEPGDFPNPLGTPYLEVEVSLRPKDYTRSYTFISGKIIDSTGLPEHHNLKLKVAKQTIKFIVTPDPDGSVLENFDHFSVLLVVAEIYMDLALAPPKKFPL